MRNAWLPVTTVIGLQVGGLLAGAVITETVFAWNGVGRWVVEAIQNRDYFVIQSSILIFALIFLVVNLLVDIGYAFLNPRIRYSWMATSALPRDPSPAPAAAPAAACGATRSAACAATGRPSLGLVCIASSCSLRSWPR